METTKISKKLPRNKKLTVLLKKHSGRDSGGRVSVEHQGGRQKRFYRLVDFKRSGDQNALVIAIEYDPNRGADIALIEYENGEKAYILQPEGLLIGAKIASGSFSEIVLGNTLPLSAIPLGTEIHNIELYPGSGGQMARGAGTYAILVAKDGRYADLKLPSKEVRKVLLTCRATIGRLSNSGLKNEKIGTAGRARHMGIRPTVRGVAQNPRSHPHGGGEGKTGEAMHPKTAQGRSARGNRTRNKKKSSQKLLVSRRRP
ncbi:50S ribosomal protein L2 [Candidatus Roizmanbacteria bacterium RIFCSPHIGHO2_01_FULL_39_24]|uniref:Large ribosomal subunit protein uL2 n=1 Tax=Candidatus Roizmanbacteria bacterium RIFCSPHIGHO2_01_FULL_39_24 TaxID=1802032 RepID=A0A1F7GLT6_9BACT|nr:MAG: 50S ribosomal protein L2 [Candidatus Roizmanbacteria bacterium RIFCSPHIGHO2_01_FULL_39_24]OGK49947.1 MAG: 50S ribosomal protein L2 [Candidatus Roizmanbacteria bacterium RIFCSPLOWO2_01_FULL_40_32]